MTSTFSNLANAIRVLTIDAVARANSGHLGAPMGMADIMTVFWRDFFKHNPANPIWPDRDRFVLSNGHGSMLLYSALHLSGYALDLTSLRNFRQFGSATPGHPEVDMTPGVEATTGPLGQGFANAVGMAIAEQALAARYNRPDLPIVDHRTWVFLGDGCLMEGVSHEAASLAGVLQLGKLTAIYDNNNVSIDGRVDPWLNDNTPERFRAYGWHVIDQVDGHNPEAIAEAIAEAKKEPGKPSLICAQTIIGFGSPDKQGNASMHGAGLGKEEAINTKQALNWPHEAFDIPQEVYAGWDCQAKGEAFEGHWQTLWQNYQQKYPRYAEELAEAWDHKLPQDFTVRYQRFISETLQDAPVVATRAASKLCLDVIGPLLPNLLGGSADLTDSCCVKWSGCTTMTPTSRDGNYLHYGVREFAMTAIGNGIGLHGGLRPYTSTFLTFSDYARNAVRMSALMKVPHVLVYTHDSIGVGEDGPTHQPIEHLTCLRTTPELSVWRPCDLAETAVAWQMALTKTSGPTALVLSRQKLTPQKHTDITDIEKGGYVLVKEAGKLQLILIATGSEVSLAVEAASLLAREKIGVRVVSMPSVDLFEQQDDSWQKAVLPPQVRCRLVIEAGHPDYWYKFAGLDGEVLGIDRFGASAPGDELMMIFGFTPETVVTRAKKLLQKIGQGGLNS